MGTESERVFVVCRTGVEDEAVDRDERVERVGVGVKTGGQGGNRREDVEVRVRVRVSVGRVDDAVMVVLELDDELERE